MYIYLPGGVSEETMRKFHKHKKETEIILLMILVTIMLGFVIYIRGYLLSPHGRFFSGHPHVKDSTTYFAKMLQGSRKGILYYKNHLFGWAAVLGLV